MRIAYLCFDEGIPIGGDKGASTHVSEMVRAFGDIHGGISFKYKMRFTWIMIRCHEKGVYH